MKSSGSNYRYYQAKATYASFCRRYTGWPGGMLAISGIALCTLSNLQDLGMGLFGGAAVGLIGEEKGPRWLKQRGYSLQQGSQLLPRMQAGFAAAVIILGAGMEITKRANGIRTDLTFFISPDRPLIQIPVHWPEISVR